MSPGPSAGDWKTQFAGRKSGARLVALIKPQFEVGKGGVVREPDLHEEVCARIEAWLGAQEGWCVGGATESPILGREGNREFQIAAAREESA